MFFTLDKLKACSKKIYSLVIVMFSLSLFSCTSDIASSAGPQGHARTLHAWLGTAPQLDGIIAANEYDDADSFVFDSTWNYDLGPIKDPRDLSMKGWVKHDGSNLYFAFDVTDNLVYGLDTPRWLPPENALVHEYSALGWPWYGDGIEIFMHPLYKFNLPNAKMAGDESSYTLVFSSHKSSLDGLAAGGTMPGEPRSKTGTWERYHKWIVDGLVTSKVRIKNKDLEGSGYVIEAKLANNPFLMIEEGLYWDLSQGQRTIGFNMELQDLDLATASKGFGGFNYIGYWSGQKGRKEFLSQWGQLVLEAIHKQ